MGAGNEASTYLFDKCSPVPLNPKSYGTVIIRADPKTVLYAGIGTLCPPVLDCIQNPIAYVIDVDREDPEVRIGIAPAKQLIPVYLGDEAIRGLQTVPPIEVAILQPFNAL